MKKVLALLAILLPNKFKIIFYNFFFGFEIHSTSRIGFSLILTQNLSLGRNSRIGHCNVIKGLTDVSLGESASIGNLNWISGFPKNTDSLHFADQIARIPTLVLGDHAAITNRHLIDCTDAVTIGRFSTFAGFRSQILTHSISVPLARQRSGPVVIGDYSFVGTGSIVLPNSSLPSFSVLGAGSVLNKQYTKEYHLYAGNPARSIKEIKCDAQYFIRKTGFVQ